VRARGGRLGIRESIFKTSHTESRKEVRNLDPRSDPARAPLHLARWVYEGEESGESGESGEGRQGGGQCGGMVWRQGVASSQGDAPPPPPTGAPRPPPAPTPRPRTEDLQAPRGPRGLHGAPRGPGLPLGEAWEVVRSSWPRFLAASRFLKFPILNGEKEFRTWTFGPIWRARVCIWPGGSMKGAERAPKASGPMALGEDVRATPGRLSRRSESC
jgi:hypothetical protein